MASHMFLRNSNGNRYFLYLYRNDNGRWNWDYNWLDNNRNANNPSVLLATYFFSPPLLAGEFCFAGTDCRAL